MIFTEKLQNYQYYHQVKLTNMNMLEVKNNYPFTKVEWILIIFPENKP